LQHLYNGFLWYVFVIILELVIIIFIYRKIGLLYYIILLTWHY